MKSNIWELCFYPLLICSMVNCNSTEDNYEQYLDLPAVKKFREYLRIDTSQEKNIQLAVDFFRCQAEELGLPFTVYTTKGGLPICIITLEGKDPTLPSIMLNSHMDVVPADATEWTYPPFEALVDDEGNIYARGAQDTKDIAIQYLEVIKRLIEANVTLLRTLHITCMPDEETGGFRGMRQFLDTDKFKNLNIGFALDEGLVSEAEKVLNPMYQDRRPWQMNFTIHGQGGHGSSLTQNTAVENAYKMLKLIMKFRDEQREIMKSKEKLDYGSYTSINVNILQAGVAVNVIPTEVTVVVDMRLSVDSEISDIENMVKSWMDAAGNQTEVTFIRREDKSEKTAIDDSNPFWVAMKQTLTDLGLSVVPIVCPATTDILQMRNRGYPAIGFNTKTATRPRLHGLDEYVNIKTFVVGIDIYFEVIKAIANVGYEMVPIVCPGTSDMMILRNKGIPAIGFSAKTSMKLRAHGKDEYMSVKTFLKGINVYFEAIKAIANVKCEFNDNFHNFLRCEI